MRRYLEVDSLFYVAIPPFFFIAHRSLACEINAVKWKIIQDGSVMSVAFKALTGEPSKRDGAEAILTYCRAFSTLLS